MIFDISYLIFGKFTMKISIISASHRVNSQSKKISEFLQNNLSKIDSKLNTNILDLADAGLPLWSPEKKKWERYLGRNLEFNIRKP